MRINYILFFAAFLVFQYIPTVIRAQEIDKRGPVHYTPGGYLDEIYDLYGKRYSLGRLMISKDARPLGTGDSTFAATPASCSSGYFQLWLKPGCGMDGTDAVSVARLNVLCQVLSDLSAFISSPCSVTGQKVNILVDSGVSGSALGVASPFFYMPNSLSISGIVDNTIWLTLNSGTDGFANVAAPLYSSTSGYSGSTYYHGSIKFNFASSVAWHTDLTTPPDVGEMDLYTVALHEMMHAMGFASLINYDGNSFFTASFTYFSRYDTHLATTAGQSLITHTGSAGCGMYNWYFNPTLLPASTTLSPGGISVCPLGYQTGGTADHTICSHKVEYNGSWSVPIPVYTPECFEKGASLSHFEDECHVPPGFVVGSAGSATNNQYYVMSNSGPAGPYNVVTNPGAMKRYPKPEERQVLCDIGYTVGTTYGSATTLNNYSYVGGPCIGPGVVGINDGISPGGIYTYTTTTTTPVNINPAFAPFLANDYGTTGGSFKCLEIVNGGGTLSVTSGTAGTPVIFTPSASVGGVQLLRYIPVSSTGAEGNITYLLVYVWENCPPSACNLVLNGGFENVRNPGGGFLWKANCWSEVAATPDLFERGCTTPWWCFPMYSLSRNNTVHPVDTVGNDHYIGIVAGNYTAGSISEAVQGLLYPGLINGETYHMGFWARISDIPPTPGLPSGYDTVPAHLQFAIRTTYPLVSSTYALSALPPGVNLIADMVVTHPDVFWHYYDTTFTYTGPTGARALIIMQAPWIDSEESRTYLMLDDLSIIPASSACSLDLPDTILYGNTLHLDSFVSIPGGTYSWYADSDGIRTISHNSLFNSIKAHKAVLTTGTSGLVSVCYKYATALGCIHEVCDEIYIKYTPSGIADILPSYNFTVAPNPTADDVTVIGDIDDSYDGNTVTVTLEDMLGRNLLKETAIVINGKVNKKMSVRDVANGQYLIRITSGSGNAVIRIAVQK